MNTVKLVRYMLIMNSRRHAISQRRWFEDLGISVQSMSHCWKHDVFASAPNQWSIGRDGREYIAYLKIENNTAGAISSWVNYPISGTVFASLLVDYSMTFVLEFILDTFFSIFFWRRIGEVGLERIIRNLGAMLKQLPELRGFTVEPKRPLSMTANADHAQEPINIVPHKCKVGLPPYWKLLLWAWQLPWKKDGVYERAMLEAEW